MAREIQRVLMTADCVGGVFTYAIELILALSKRGVSVVLATLGPPPSPEQRAQVAAIEGATLEVGSFKLEWMEGAAEDLAPSGAWLRALEAQYRPDVIHLNGYAHGAEPFFAPKLVVAHSCVLSWWQAVRAETPPSSWDGYRTAVQRGLAEADAVAAPTRALLSELERIYGTHAPAVVIPNGVDPARIAPAQKEDIVLTAGRLWDAAKNIEALDHVAPRCPWPVLAIGDARAPEGQTRALTHLWRLGALPREAVLTWFARAEIFALPARYEPFGLSALEAALSGAALILGDIPSLREVWGDDAIFVDPEDHAGLEAALRRLIEAPEERNDLRTRCRRRAAGHTAEAMGRAYLELYRALPSAR